MLCQCSRTSHRKGGLLMRSSVSFWYWKVGGRPSRYGDRREKLWIKARGMTQTRLTEGKRRSSRIRWARTRQLPPSKSNSRARSIQIRNRHRARATTAQQEDQVFSDNERKSRRERRMPTNKASSLPHTLSSDAVCMISKQHCWNMRHKAEMNRCSRGERREGTAGECKRERGWEVVKVQVSQSPTYFLICVQGTFVYAPFSWGPGYLDLSNRPLIIIPALQVFTRDLAFTSKPNHPAVMLTRNLIFTLFANNPTVR